MSMLYTTYYNGNLTIPHILGIFNILLDSFKNINLLFLPNNLKLLFVPPPPPPPPPSPLNLPMSILYHYADEEHQVNMYW